MRNHSEYNVDIKVGHVAADKIKKVKFRRTNSTSEKEKGKDIHRKKWKLLSEIDNIDKGEDDRPSQELPKQDDGL